MPVARISRLTFLRMAPTAIKQTMTMYAQPSGVTLQRLEPAFLLRVIVAFENLNSKVTS